MREGRVIESAGSIELQAKWVNTVVRRGVERSIGRTVDISITGKSSHANSPKPASLNCRDRLQSTGKISPYALIL